MDIIDSKKIMEASEKYAKEMEETCKKLAKKYKSSTSLCNWVTVNPEAAFKDGINWFLKNLWHPVSEEPKKARVFLYKTMFEGYGLNKVIDGNEWKYIIKYQKATQWLYLDDLFPKEGDKHD